MPALVAAFKDPAVVAELQEAWGDGSAGSQGSCTSSVQDLFRRRQLFVWKNKCAFTNLSMDQVSLQACRIIPLRAKFHSLDLGWEVRLVLRELCECSYSHVGPARGTQVWQRDAWTLVDQQGQDVGAPASGPQATRPHYFAEPLQQWVFGHTGVLLYAAVCVRSPADRC